MVTSLVGVYPESAACTTKKPHILPAILWQYAVIWGMGLDV